MEHNKIQQKKYIKYITPFYITLYENIEEFNKKYVNVHQYI